MSLRTALESVPEELWSDGFVQIRPLKTESDLVYAIFECRLTEEQKDLVNPAAFSIARAYLSGENNYPCIICDEKMEPIGFINLCRWLGEGEATSWSYCIDAAHQGRGYGKAAARLAIRILKAADSAKPIKLSTEICNEKAQRLYRSLGFVLLPERDGDDLVFGV